jgi:hypothetical protein
MALINNCGVSNPSPYCVCTDYYGNVLPEYKYFNESLQTYSCCNNLNGYTALNSTSIDDNDINLVQFASSSTPECSNFYNTIGTNGRLKNFPLIYYQALLNGALYQKFTGPGFSVNNDISCNTGIPYYVSFPNYSNNEINYKILCGSSNTSDFKDIKFLNSNVEVPYSVNYVLNEDGTNCTTSTCTTKYNISTLNEYNIGDKIYTSNGSINSESLLLKWWFWFVLLLIIFVVGFFIYFAYYHGMNKYFNQASNYLNNVKSGLGDTAKIHAKKKQKAHFHLNA